MNIKTRLAIMNFWEFAVWGAYLTSMGNYLGKAGMGMEIPWFYAIQGIVSLFMPTLVGIIADRLVQPQRMLGYCHLIAGIFMAGLFLLGEGAGCPDKTLFMSLYTISLAFYMPTLALSNTVAFATLANRGLDTVRDFPPIRVFGTVGFVAAMWFVNCAVLDHGAFGFTLADNDGKFQYTHLQFLVSGILGISLFLYCLSLPQCRLRGKRRQTLAETFGVDAFRLLRSRRMAMFFVFSGLLGMSLQITNGYATPFITSFKGIPGMSDSFAANNATLLVSVSQVSEAMCILLIPYFMRRYGIKMVMLIAMVAWVLRFGLFGLGNPTFPGVMLFVLSCVVYGVAFDFFNVSGGLFVNSECSESVKASAQGLFMLMTNGLGATVGTLLAGKVVNRFCHWTADGYLLGDWPACWFIFAGYALIVALLFMLLFGNTAADKSKCTEK